MAHGTKRQLELLGCESLEINGLKDGVIIDLVDLVSSIQNVLKKVSAHSGARIKKVLVSINGNYINARSSFASFAFSDRANRHVTGSDINYLRRQARLLGLSVNDFLLHEFPQDYILDDQHTTARPLGLLARKVQLNSYLLSVDHSFYGNIITAIQQAGYEVVKAVFSGVASSLSVLSSEARERGVVLLDMARLLRAYFFSKMLFCVIIRLFVLPAMILRMISRVAWSCHGSLLRRLKNLL